MTTYIDFHKTTADHFKRNYVLNYVELTPLGKTMLDGADSVEFNGQFIDVYKGTTRVYSFGFTKYEACEHWYGKAGFELEG